ncbi:hypothetical protein HPP92_017178 [Vanilla planifolia]|uniref:Uncharacterized protein n=1 Tax=Vanilla planifolia TaxID=51239 RepID=A0A835QBW2_VANPL|nr:hypothetical protein HPP92_017178 [Vanilla planifolia]
MSRVLCSIGKNVERIVRLSRYCPNNEQSYLLEQSSIIDGDIERTRLEAGKMFVDQLREKDFFF